MKWLCRNLRCFNPDILSNPLYSYMSKKLEDILDSCYFWTLPSTPNTPHYPQIGGAHTCEQWAALDSRRPDTELPPTQRRAEQMWEVLKSCDKLWEILSNYQKLWETVEKWGKMWRPVRNCEELWESVRFFEKPWYIEMRACEKQTDNIMV